MYSVTHLYGWSTLYLHCYYTSAYHPCLKQNHSIFFYLHSTSFPSLHSTINCTNCIPLFLSSQCSDETLNTVPSPYICGTFSKGYCNSSWPATSNSCMETTLFIILVWHMVHSVFLKKNKKNYTFEEKVIYHGISNKLGTFWNVFHYLSKSNQNKQVFS